MTSRTTKKTVQAYIDFLNLELYGSQEAYKTIDGKFTAIGGRYVLDAANGGYKLNRICEDGHGETDVSYYRQSAKELFIVVKSMLNMAEHQRRGK